MRTKYQPTQYKPDIIVILGNRIYNKISSKIKENLSDIQDSIIVTSHRWIEVTN